MKTLNQNTESVGNMKKTKLVYKLTDQNGRTYNNTQWGPGVSHSGTGKGGLCGPGFIHYYSDPLLAVFLNPVHANFSFPKLWKAKAAGKIKSDNGLKFGCETLTTVREIPLPVVTTEQRVRFAILCALEVYAEPGFKLWAKKWLFGEGRTAKSAARATARAASAAASKRFSLIRLAREAVSSTQQ